ncbi:MAG: ACP S-malonyltransferase [Deltaproteobacteria bacterium]|nr:ACP S-malonyltransferase [Deltaproteobacteria bacterium]
MGEMMMGPFGVVFPGQGSQYPGMGQDLYRRNQSVRELFATAGEVLGRDMAALCFEGPQEALDLTANTQIAVLMADLAAWIAFSERVTKAPAVLAGHSLGEYAALFAAGAVGLRDVLSLVDLRGKYHQEAVPVGEGAMAAILGLPRAAVEELCRGIDREKNVVNLSIENAPGQIVVSGHAAAIDQVIAAAETKEGGRGVKLPISVPCHSPLLQSAADRFAAALEKVDFGECRVPVIPNCCPGLLHSREKSRELLARQITSPVGWKETIERIAAMGIDTIVELGPKRTLSGLIRRIDRRLRLLNVEDGDSLEKTVAELNSSTQ